MKKIITILFLFSSIIAFAQNKNGLISGPWAGNVELRNATVWLEVSADVKNVSVKYHPENSSDEKTIEYNGELRKDFNPIKIELNGLEVNTVYLYDVIIDGKKTEPVFATKFTAIRFAGAVVFWFVKISTTASEESEVRCRFAPLP